jgi:nucleoid-associated protein YgaU
VRVALHGSGVERQRTEVRVFDGAAVVGAATHTWTTTPSVTLDVPWWPLEAGARALRVDAAPIDGEVMLVDNQAAIGATVSARPADVLVFDARPSWHSTFVRRALEDDARFSVEHRSRLAPALTAGTAGGRLDAAALDRAALLVIGGPDALTAADVDLLERYTRVRGGSLVLLPDRRPSGPVARLFDGTWTEQLSPAAAAIGPLRASEVLRARSLSPAVTVIATAAGAPSIASLPRGEGRIVVAGAMDAWRYRTDAFDRFWRSLAADAAAAGQPLTLAFDDPLAAAGGHARFTFRDRAMAPPSALEASAVQRCNDGPATVIRLWPAGPLGEFSGEAAADAAGRCVVEARAAHRQVSASLAVMDRPARGVDRTLAKLERQARGSGGAIADAGNLSTIARALETSADAMSRVVTVHPMRSPWWLLPFAASLSIEWWLRRRHGLR